MTLKIYNTLTQQKETFKPLKPGKIGMYVCGMTVYDYCHMGHARTMVAFDVIARYLRAAGYELNYICNITDIDDKIIHRANENNENYSELTARFVQAMQEDMQALNILPPDHQPRATAHIAEMRVMISTLLEQGAAYVGEDGDVYYDVTTFQDYGKLSHRNLAQLQSGIRVEVAEAKKSPLDFVLWKKAKPGEPAWDSPWGKGRPGWHIECSAMSTQCLGAHFDIHGGGSDLIFPHHENEIAQSEASTHQTFANYWLHVGHLQINKEKMSKSLGNFFTIREVLKTHHPEVIRYFIMTSHYRSPLNYTEEALLNARAALERLYLALRGCATVLEKPAEKTQWETRFHAAMLDDFNTPEALAILFEMTRELNRLKIDNPTQAATLAHILKNLAKTLGLLEAEPDIFLCASSGQQVDVDHIEALIKARNDARAAKEWARADEVRDELQALGVLIEDGKTGTTWRYYK